ncbi:MAG: hypothetical protein WCO77_01465 [bacterium]
MNQHQIAKLNDLKLIPKIGEGMEDLFFWLEKEKLVQPASTYEQPMQIENPMEQSDRIVSFTTVAVPISRAPAFTARQREVRVKDWRQKYPQAGPKTEANAGVWAELAHARDAVRSLDLRRIPADAMAFYRPFHFPPFDQWGIYLLVEPLMDYFGKLARAVKDIQAFTPVTLMHAVLFEIFHHEFFHHLTESTATTVELILAACGQKKAIYVDYWNRRFRSQLPAHPHEPLEEALANVYAYNSLAFISRVKAGYKTMAVKLYQEVVERYWCTEPKGYREAAHYINGGQTPGAAHLLAMLLNEPSRGDAVPLMKLAKSVMPNGFTAFSSKPEIPTYLVGNAQVVKAFLDLVPIPVEAYTSLFWPVETPELDGFIKKKNEDEKKAREDKKETARKAAETTRGELF